MIQARKLGHIVLKVRDAAKSRDFYTRTLGLRVAHEDLAAVFLSFGETHHELALFQLATGQAADPTRPGLHHMAWQLGNVEELQAAYREILRTDLERTLRLLGCASIAALDHSYVNVSKSWLSQREGGPAVHRIRSPGDARERRPALPGV
jgi:catechol 2,3-dioxygenase-like lactoylglutathione lyase family enzyme